MQEGTKKTTTQVLNMIQKLPETVIIHLKKVGEDQWRFAQGSKRQVGE